MQITRFPKTLIVGAVLATGLAFGLTACGTNSTADLKPAAAVKYDKITVGSTVDKTGTVLAETSVGDTQYVIAKQDNEIRIGQTTNGELDGWMTFDDHAVAADSIVVSAGNSPDLGTKGYADTEGKVGSDVTSLDIVTADGATVQAAVSNGWYVAAWEGDDFNDETRMNQKFIVHLKDGSTKTIAYADAPTFTD